MLTEIIFLITVFNLTKNYCLCAGVSQWTPTNHLKTCWICLTQLHNHLIQITLCYPIQVAPQYLVQVAPVTEYLPQYLVQVGPQHLPVAQLLSVTFQFLLFFYVCYFFWLSFIEMVVLYHRFIL